MTRFNILTTKLFFFLKKKSLICLVIIEQFLLKLSDNQVSLAYSIAISRAFSFIQKCVYGKLRAQNLCSGSYQLYTSKVKENTYTNTLLPPFTFFRCPKFFRLLIFNGLGCVYSSLLKVEQRYFRQETVTMSTDIANPGVNQIRMGGQIVKWEHSCKIFTKQTNSVGLLSGKSVS